MVYMYILLCCDDSYYIGRTFDLESRIQQHQNRHGADHTKERLPVTTKRFSELMMLLKQVQRWSRKKKEALIKGDVVLLSELSIAYSDMNKIEILRAEALEAGS